MRYTLAAILVASVEVGVKFRTMTKKVGSALLCSQLLLAGSAQALLKPGDNAPDFTLEAAQAGNAFSYSLADALKQGPVVLYFYPKAFTGGCSVEARMFARAKEEFAAMGASIIGVSSDGIDTLKDFSVKDCNKKFPVGADPDGRVIRSYDAGMAFGTTTSKRASYVITPEHKVFYVYSDMSPKEHVNKTLDALKLWKQGQVEQSSSAATAAKTTP